MKKVILAVVMGLMLMMVVSSALAIRGYVPATDSSRESDCTWSPINSIHISQSILWSPTVTFYGYYGARHIQLGGRNPCSWYY